MDTQTQRQRQAEALANSQIPGYVPEEASETAPRKAAPVAVSADRDILDVSGAPAEAPTDAEIARITHDVVRAFWIADLPVWDSCG